MTRTPDDGGYGLVGSGGGVFALRHPPFYGSIGGKPLNAVVDLDVSPDGKGYRMAAEDGGVVAFGSAGFYGSLAGPPLNGHVTGMSVTTTGRGYWLNGCGGGVFAFGGAVFRGSNPTFHDGPQLPGGREPQPRHAQRPSRRRLRTPLGDELD